MKKIRLRFKTKDKVVIIDVDTSHIKEPQRDLLSVRLWGIDVLQLWNDDKGTTQVFEDKEFTRPVLIEAKGESFDDLMTAIGEENRRLKERQQKHMECAWAMAVIGMDRSSMIRSVSRAV